MKKIFIIISVFMAAPAMAQMPQWQVPTKSVTPADKPPEAVAPQQNLAPPQNNDTSEELLTVDRNLADSIFDKGPLVGYSNFISSVGILYDASGASPAGIEAVNSRFSAFPSEIKLERRPEKAMASGSAGASWGAYAIKRDGNILSQGRYTTIWRKEDSGWRIVCELAAGRDSSPAVLPVQPGFNKAQTTNEVKMPAMRDALARPVKDNAGRGDANPQ